MESFIDYINNISDRITNDEYVTDNECNLFLSAFSNIPLEYIEARYSYMKGENFLECPQNL